MYACNFFWAKDAADNIQAVTEGRECTMHHW